MAAKNLEISYLLDFYGDVLTDKQRDVMEQYYNDDFSLSEIADNFGITRLQGEYSSIIATNTGKGQMRSLSKLFFKDKGVIYQCSNTAISLVKTNSAQFERLSNLFWIASGVFAAFKIGRAHV